MVLALAIGCMMATIPGQTIGVSVVLDRIIDELAISRSLASTLYMIGSLCGAVTMPWFGRQLDRRGLRVCSILVVLFFSLACALMASVTTIWLLLLAFIGVRGLGQGALGMTSTQTVNLWFTRRRGLAMGLLGVGMAIANATIPRIMEWSTVEFGWRQTYYGASTILLFGLLPLVWLLIVNPPASRAAVPASASSKRHQTSLEFTMRMAIRTPHFWYVALSGFLTAGIGTALLFHNFSLLEVNGVDRATASWMLVAFAFSLAISHLLTGLLLDRMLPHALITVAQALVIACLGVLGIAVSLPTVVVYGLVVGIPMGMQGAIGGVAYAQYFGTRYLGEIRGVAFMTGVGGAAIGPLPFALAYEANGTYAAALIGSGVLCLGLLIWGWWRVRGLPAYATD